MITALYVQCKMYYTLHNKYILNRILYIDFNLLKYSSGVEFRFNELYLVYTQDVNYEIILY